MTYLDAKKEDFNEQPRAVISGVVSGDKLFIIRYFNARFGSNYRIWGPVLAKFGRGQHNSNGELFTYLCSELETIETNETIDRVA